MVVDIINAEAKHSNSLVAKPLRPPSVRRLTSRTVVVGPIDFHAQTGGRTIEVENVATDGVLPAKSQMAQLFAAK